MQNILYFLLNKTNKNMKIKKLGLKPWQPFLNVTSGMFPASTSRTLLVKTTELKLGVSIMKTGTNRKSFNNIYHSGQVLIIDYLDV